MRSKCAGKTCVVLWGQFMAYRAASGDNLRTVSGRGVTREGGETDGGEYERSYDRVWEAPQEGYMKLNVDVGMMVRWKWG